MAGPLFLVAVSIFQLVRALPNGIMNTETEKAAFRSSSRVIRMIAGVLAIVAATSGCGSIMARGYLEPEFPGTNPPPYFYRGVVVDVRDAIEADSDAPVWLLPIALTGQTIDLVLCLAADTLFLPFDLVVWLKAADTSDESGSESIEE